MMMRYFGFLLLVLFLTPPAMAQGTLQFSQVLMVDNVQQTVPLGKVWKVETVLPVNGFIRTYTDYVSTPARGVSADYIIVVNGNNVSLGHVLAGVTAGYTNNTMATSSVYTAVNSGLFPIWLPAGSTLQASTNIRYISVIEFNIIP